MSITNVWTEGDAVMVEKQMVSDSLDQVGKHREPLSIERGSLQFLVQSLNGFDRCGSGDRATISCMTASDDITVLGDIDRHIVRGSLPQSFVVVVAQRLTKR